MRALIQKNSPIFDGTIVVTGAAGYLGTHFLCAVSEYAYRVIAIDKNPILRTASNVIAVVGDLNEKTTHMRIENAINSISQKTIYWFHFAALFPKSFDSRGELTWDNFETNNLQATRNLIAIAKRHPETKLFFFPSTAHLDRKIETAGLGLDFYGRSKAINEKELATYNDLRTVIWRLPRIIGLQAHSFYMPQTGILELHCLHATFKLLIRSSELPEDIVSLFLLRATENPLNPTLKISNPTLKRTYAHISELTKSLIDLIASNSQTDYALKKVTFPVEEVTIHQIGTFIVEELKAHAIPIRFVHDGNSQELTASVVTTEENRADPVVQRSVGEYFTLAVQRM